MILSFMFLTITAFFVLSEFSIIRSRKFRTDNKYSLLVLDNINVYLSSCQLGITASTLALGMLGEEEIKLVLSHFTWSKFLSPVVLSIIIAIPLTIFGEIIPKSIGISLAEKALNKISFLLYAFNLIVHPITWTLTKISSLFLRIVGLPVVSSEETFSDTELRDIIEHNLDDGTTKDIIDNVFAFDDIRVSDIMTHRNDIHGIDIVKLKDSTPESVEYLKAMVLNGYSRVPVYANNIDDIRGVLHTKDLLGLDLAEIKLSKIMKKALFVPETLKIKTIFNDMKKRGTHLAIVLDEYSGVSGLVTFEDILEIIMGNIVDEHDDEEDLKCSVDDDGVLTIDSRVKLDDLIDVFPTIPDIAGITTVSGLVNFIFEKIPVKGEKKLFSGCEFVILESNAKQCRTVKITKVED